MQRARCQFLLIGEICIWRSSRIAARGHHARRQSPRSHVGPADVRLLHDRGAAGESDWRSRVGQRQTGRSVARARHRDDRAARIQSRSQDDAGRPAAAPLRAALDRRAVLCPDSVATSAPGSMGISPDQFPRFRAARGSMQFAQAVLRWVLPSAWKSRSRRAERFLVESVQLPPAREWRNTLL